MLVTTRRAQPNKLLGDGLLTAGLTILYCLSFIAIYKLWAAKLYAIFGLRDTAQSALQLTASVFIVAYLSWRLPKTLSRFSDFFVWMTFLLIFIPTLLVLGMAKYSSFNSWIAMASVTGSFLVLWAFSRAIHGFSPAPRGSVSFFSVRPLILESGFFISYFILNVIVLIIYGTSLNFASLEAGVGQRQIAAVAGSGTIGLYAVNWLSNVFNPYLIATGIFNRSNRWKIFIGIAGQILVYSTYAGKITLTSLVMMVLFSMFVTSKPVMKSWRLVAGCAGGTVLTLAGLTAFSFQPTGLPLLIFSLAFMRTFAIQGAMLGAYLNFFSGNPLTMGSHIGLLRGLIEYPYDRPLAYEIGRYMVGGTGFGANANFWAGDGVAAFGMLGIVPAGAIVGIIVGAVDRAIQHQNLRFALLFAIPWFMSMANTSFFTSMVTGGGILGFLLIYVGQVDASQPKRSRVVRR